MKHNTLPFEAQIGPRISESRKKDHKRLWGRLSSHKRRARLQHSYIAEKIPLHKYDEVYNPHKLAALYHCGTELSLKEYANGTGIVSGQNCRQHTLCPLCAIVRAAKYWRAYREKYLYLLSQCEDLTAYYLVLTVKNEDSLPERFNHLEVALRKLIKRRCDAISAVNGNKRNLCYLNSSFAGTVAGAYSIEIKRGANSGAWHPHANVLLIHEATIKQPALKIDGIKEEWNRLTGDSYICSLQKITTKEAGFREVFKYALKFSAMSPADTWLAFTTLYKRRLFGSFGAFRGLQVDDTKVDLSDVPYIEYLCKYANKNYQLTNINHVNNG